MTLRVTFNTAYRNGNAALQEVAANLVERQAEVASGKRMQAPSDDPTAASGAVAERAEIATLDQYVKAADSVTSRLTVVDASLSDMVTQITAAKTATLSASGSTVDVTRRDAVAKQLAGIKDSILSDVNAQFNGAYLFSGNGSTVAPYTRTGATVSAYQGTSTVTSVDVSRQTAMATTFDGEAMLKGGDTDDVFTTLDTLITAVQSGDQTAVDAGMQALDRAFDRVTLVQTQVGTDLAGLDDQRARLGVLQQTSTARLSKYEDADMAQAVSDMTQAQTAYQAALGALGTTSKLTLLDYLR